MNLMESQGDAGGLGDVPAPRRWGRVADVIEGGVIYMEDAERLVLAGITLPSDPAKYTQAHAYLSELVADTIVFYEASESDSLGRLIAEVWVGDVHVNNALRALGYSV